MLQSEGALLTWALDEELCSKGDVSAVQLADHRLTYLDHEGPVSGDRGTVTQWDSGEFQWRQRTSERIEVTLSGQIIQGEVTLKRLSDGGDDAQRWSVSLRKS